MKTTTRHYLRCATFALGTVFVSAYAAHAADPMPSTTSTNAMKVSHADRNFFEKAAKSGMKEVSVSQSVSGRLMNPQVRDFAQMMVTDHTAANNELMSLASSKGVTLPTADARMAEKWSKKNKGVDKDYLDEMVSDHKDAVDLFEKASKSDDPDVAAFAQKTLPKLQHHLMMAKDLKDATK